MKKSDIKVGEFYKAKVSENIVTVRVDGVRERGSTQYRRSVTLYDVTNMVTGRKLTFSSAAKFREKAVDPSKGPAKLKLKSPLFPEMNKTLVVPEADFAQAPELRSPPAYLSAETEGERPASPLSIVSTPAPSGLAATLSRYQHPDSAPHLIVTAKAGTGKTTTLVGGLQVLKGITPTDAKGRPITPSPQQRAVWDAIALSAGKVNSVGFVAFNKSIATELKSRVPPGCDAMTMHSLGFKAVNKAFNNPKMEEYRVSNIIEELTGMDVRELYKRKGALLSTVKRLVELCKMNLIGNDLIDITSLPADSAVREKLAETWEEELSQLVSHYDIDTEGVPMDEVFDLVPRVLERCKDVARDRCIDFSDMVWLPVALKLPVFKYDLLLVDEAQDLNRCQQALTRMAGHRLVYCGDPKQAIYGFAGADAESMNRMEEELAATERGIKVLPLTVTRRCGRAIVDEARKIVPDFEAHESNPDGKIITAKYPTDKEGNPRPKPHYTELVEDADMVLCRVNAPLVSQCFRFIKEGRKANIQGRDIAQGLISTVTKQKAPNVAVLIEKLSDWIASEVAKETKKRHPSESRIIALNDRYDCLMCFVDGLAMTASPDEVVRKIESVFTDDKGKAGIRLSSIHKAKGLEADRVFLLEPAGSTVPHPMAKTAWQIEQEWNLKYVAITRAIRELVYVS